MDSGNLASFVERYLGKVTIVGKHCAGNIFVKALCNIKRVLELRSFIRKIKPDVVTSFSYYPKNYP